MGKYKTLGKNSLFVMLGTLGSKIISFLMLPLYTRWLSVSDFGLTDLLTIYSTLLVSIFSLSLSESIFVFPAKQPVKEQSKYFTSGLCVILFMSFFVFVISVISSFISTSFKINNTFTDNLWLIWELYFTSQIQQYLQMFCQGINKMKAFCFAGIIFTGMTAVFSFLLIPQFGVKGFVCSNVFANICSSLFIVFYEKIYIFFSFKHCDRDTLKKMLEYSIPMIPNTIMWWILSAINRPIINAHLGLEAIGLFAVANKISSAFSSINQIFTSSWQVSVLQEFGNQQFPVFFNKIGNLYLSLLVLISSTIAICSQWIIKISVSENFFEAWKYLPIISFSVVFNGLASHAGTLFSATKTSKYFFYSSATGAICSIVFNILLIPTYGLYGAAVGFTLSQIAIGVYRAYFANKIVKIEKSITLCLLLLCNLQIILFILLEYKLLTIATYLCSVVIIMLMIKKFLRPISR